MVTLRAIDARKLRVVTLPIMLADQTLKPPWKIAVRRKNGW
jgi:hypothetical protein